MPTFTTEQITELELDIQDLVEENAELRKENAALKAALLREVATPQD